MSLSTAFAIYFVVWWVVLFAVLPWGVRSQAEDGNVAHGTDPGAPAAPKLLAKLLWTTIISAIAFGAVSYAFLRGWLTLDRLSPFF
ncbi:MAG: DUF1467 family protein [Rhizobiales bacterium]|nr:DUF1467 family protein [Hyphomicrobiales bacterium]